MLVGLHIHCQKLGGIVFSLLPIAHMNFLYYISFASSYSSNPFFTMSGSLSIIFPAPDFLLAYRTTVLKLL